MKFRLICFTLLFSFLSSGQNIKKIIDNNDLVGLKKYIDKREDIYEEISFHKEDYSVHPMIYASGKNRLDMIKMFVENKSKIDDYHTIMSIAFAISISTKNDDLIEYLYNQEPNINEICDACNGHNAIMVATVYGNEKWYFKLKSKSETAIISKDGNNLYHLIANPAHFNLSIFNDIKFIYDLDINLVNELGRTPLQFAAKSGSDSVFYDLLNLGGVYNKINDAYVDAIYGGSEIIYNYIDSNFEASPIWGIYRIGDPNDFNSYYPLELAIRYDATTIVKQIFTEMLNDIESSKNNVQIEAIVEILNSRVMEDDVFLPLWESIQWSNADLFQFTLQNMVKLNGMKLQYTAFNDQVDEEYSQLAEVVFTKFEYRAAKRKFGKEFIELLYQNIDF
jgi:ankyrin repeat protein